VNAQVAANLQPLLGTRLDLFVDILNLLGTRTTTSVAENDGRTSAWGAIATGRCASASGCATATERIRSRRVQGAVRATVLASIRSARPVALRRAQLACLALGLALVLRR
jgi:hypothetical protein